MENTEKYPIADNPIFNTTMRKLQETDPAHADLFNNINQVLLDNDNKLYKKVELLEPVAISLEEYQLKVEVGEITERDTTIYYVEGDEEESLSNLENPEFVDYETTALPATDVALKGIKSGASIFSLFSNIKAFCKGVVTLGQIVHNTEVNDPLKIPGADVTADLARKITTLNDNLGNKMHSDQLLISGTILEYALRCKVTTTILVGAAYYPPDIPINLTEYFMLVLVTVDRKTVIAIPYANSNRKSYKRDIFSGDWLGGWSLTNNDLKYEPTHNTDIFTLSSGRYYIYTNCTNIPEASDYFVEITEFIDNSYKLIEAVPVDIGKRYYYKAKKVFGNWGAWEKYIS